MDDSQKIRNLPAAHFEILASFRGRTLAIIYSHFGSRLRLQDVTYFEPGLYLTTLPVADRSDINLELFQNNSADIGIVFDRETH